MQVNIQLPGVTVLVNGKPYQFSLLQGETQKFQDDKIVLSQNSSINFDVKVPAIDTTRRNGIGPYITTESYGTMVSRDTDKHRIVLMGGKKWG